MSTPTYYEILKIEPFASTAEIEVALDTQYNQWRRLVTHHDPKVVNQANQSLQVLEQIRGTLTDTSKRSVYDAAIGIGGVQIGGLADLDALLASAAPGSAALTPPGMRQGPVASAAPPQPIARTDAWICPKCQHANAVGMQFCAKDGFKVGNPCPACSKMAELINPFCPHCGSDKQKAWNQNRADEVKGLRHQIEEQNKKIGSYSKIKNAFWNISLNAKEKELAQGLAGKIGCSAGVMSGGWLILCLGIGYMIGMEGSLFLGFAFGLVGIWVINFLARQPQADKEIQGCYDVIRGIEDQIKKVQARVYPE